MIQGETTIRVRYGETDQMGVVYYGNYPLYYEVARTELLRAVGFSYKDLEDSGIIMPVIKLECNYIASAYYDEVLTIRTTVYQAPSVKIDFNYEIFNEKKELINTGNTTLVFLNKNTRKPTRAPLVLVKTIDNN